MTNEEIKEKVIKDIEEKLGKLDSEGIRKALILIDYLCDEEKKCQRMGGNILKFDNNIKRAEEIKEHKI